VKPSALAAIVAIVGYTVVIFTSWAVVGLDYDEVGNTVESVRNGVTISVGLGTIYLIVATTILGWWRPAIREPRRIGSRWMWAIPILLMLGALVNIGTTRFDRIDDVGPYVAYLAIGCLFVGFSEELLTRGLAIVGGRGSMHERWVWVFSGVIFGLLHAPNAAFGQSVRGTVSQIGFAFVAGLTYYVTRRISGTLIVTMVLHAFWDFGVFINDHSIDGLDPRPQALGGIVFIPVVIMSIIALVKILKTGDVVEPGGDQLAPLETPTPG
jgi:membrane protease YdiL (CAAX protease family)